MSEVHGIRRRDKLINGAVDGRKAEVKGKNTYPVVDLFAGPGGLGEGFCSMRCPSDSGRYAFRTAISIEKEKYAHATLKLRHFYREFPPEGIPDEYYEYLAGNISREEMFEARPEEAAAADKSAWECTLGEESHYEVKKRIASCISGHDKWALVGGPPCQVYSLVGRSRKKPDFESDPRHLLYKEYLRIIADHKPPVFVMENVKGLLSAKIQGKNVISLIMRDLSAPEKTIFNKHSGAQYRLYSLSDEGARGLDADLRSFVVKAENYGIPQARHRIFIVGVRDDIDIKPRILSRSSSCLTVRDVIGNLPVIRSGLSRSEDSYEAWRDAIVRVKQQPWYSEERTNGFAVIAKEAENMLRQMRKCSPMEKSSTQYPTQTLMNDPFRDDRLKTLSSHESRSHMESDIQRYFFAALYSSVNRVSPRLADFPSSLLPRHRNVDMGREGKMFSDRFRVQLPDAQATTITSHISKDGHYFIHYDPAQCRSLTVREAARLQTFPDNYRFEGPRTAQYHQVGNAVPPLLAGRIAGIIYEFLEGMK